LALSGCELGLKQFGEALKLLKKLYDEYPDNLAIIGDYATALIQFGQNKKAQSILQEALEDYPNNTSLLKSLAEAQARDHQVARAYLTRAKIFLVQGQAREAGIALHAAQKSVHNDPLLAAQIKAKLKQLKDVDTD
jgi:predicted Zn-dependent protease